MGSGTVARSDGAPGAEATRVRAASMANLSMGLAAAGVTVLGLRSVSIGMPPCPFRTITGVPCPGCGMTRLADVVARGDVTTALTVDPAGTALLVLLVFVAAASALARVRARPAPLWMGGPPLAIATLSLLGIHWVTTLVAGGATTI